MRSYKIKNTLPYKKFHIICKCYHEPLNQQQKELVEEFNRKVKACEITFDFVPCLCGSHEFDLIALIDRYTMLQRTVLCVNCGLVQSNPRMSEKEYEDYYSSDIFRNIYDSRVSSEEEHYKNKYFVDKGNLILKEVEEVKKIDEHTSVLEIGAGGGWNLVSFLEKGAVCEGIDYSPMMIRLGQSHEITMIQGGIDKIKGSFDVIILNHTFEHFLNPLESLKLIKKHLKEDGIIYIAVPNIMNFNMGILQNSHTYYFDPKTFEYYCSKADLTLIRSGPAEAIHMFGIFKITHDGHSLNLDCHYKNVYSYLKNIMLKYYIK